MQDGAVFTADDKGKTFVMLPGAQEGDDGYWVFPVYCVDTGSQSTVSTLKLKATKSSESGLNWFSDSQSDKGVVTAFKFTAFTESKIGKNPILPKWCYDFEKVSEHFKISLDEIDEVLGQNFTEIKDPAERSHYRKWTNWMRRQPLKAILLDEYLTSAGALNADGKRRRYGTLTYEVIDRVPIG